MSDQDVRARTLIQTAAGKLKKLTEVIEYVAAEETGIMQSRDICHESADISGIRKSGYKRGDRSDGQRGGGQRGDGQRLKFAYCGELSHGKNSSREREKSCKAWNKTCSNCQKLHHLSSSCRSAKAVPAASSDTTAAAEASAMVGFIASIEATPPTSALSLAALVAHLRQTGPVTSIPLPHHIHKVASGWQKSNPATSPTLLVEVTLNRPA